MLNKLYRNKIVIRLISTTAIAQILLFAISPIITRLYSPSDFGYFTFFCSAAGIIAVWSNGRYDLALVVSNNKKTTNALFFAGLLFSICVCLIILLIFEIFGQYLHLNVEINNLIIFCYIAVILTISINSLFNYYLTSMGEFNVIGNALITKALILSLFQITFGFYELGGNGLIIGWTLGFISSTLVMYSYAAHKQLHLKKINIIKINKVIKKYKRFPLYSAPASFLSAISGQAHNLLIPILYNMSTLGIYALAERLLSAPITLIGNSISQVYFKKISNLKVNIYSEFKSVIIKLSIISITILIVVQLSARILFSVIFGDNWSDSADVAIILSYQFCVQLIVSPILVTLQVIKRNDLELIFQLIMLLTYITFYLLAFFNTWSFLTLATFLSFIVSLNYLCIGVLIFYILNKRSLCDKA